jgi:hypothetical protein
MGATMPVLVALSAWSMRRAERAAASPVEVGETR